MALKLETLCVVLDSGNADALSTFYANLLGWTRYGNAGDEWIVVVSGKNDGRPELVFQQVEQYLPPVWPDAPEEQRQMLHLDFHVEDLSEGVAHAIACGATLSPVQLEDAWRVLLDPAGHPFCILEKKYPHGFPTG